MWICRHWCPFLFSWLLQKRRFSWSDTDSHSSSPPVVCKRTKCCEEQHQWPYVDKGEGSSGTPSLSSHMNQSDKRVSETLEHKVIRWSGSRLTWVHIAPIFSPPKSGPSHKGGMANDRGSGSILLPVSPLTSRSSPATQDSFISSTTPFSEPAGCQCQSVSLGTTSPLQEYTQIPQITMKPSNLEKQSPLQTWCRKTKHNQPKVFSVSEMNWSMGCWSGCLLQWLKKYF